MKDQLREHIQNNREEFDLYRSDYEQIWENVEKRLEKKTRPLWPRVMKIAASVILVLASGLIFLKLQTNSALYSDGFDLRNISPELAEAEFYYNSLVEEKLSIIKSGDGEIDPIVVEEFQSLDSAYAELKLDLKDNMDNEEVIDAMIQNYRIKLKILEQILDNIQKSDELNKDNEESISI